MKLTDHTPIDTVHLIIHPQDQFLYNLSARRLREYPPALRHFTDDIAPLAPTIIVARGTEFAVHMAAPTEKFAQIRKTHGLSSLEIRDHEIVVTTPNEPENDNAFHGGFLETFLKQTFPNLTGVVTTGMNTRYCLGDSAAGGRTAGLSCTVIYDLAADSRPSSCDAAPQWHKDRLQRKLAETNVVVTDQHSFMRSLGTAPALAGIGIAQPRHQLSRA